jgi:predicted phage terminase large subunit-like protein
VKNTGYKRTEQYKKDRKLLIERYRIAMESDMELFAKYILSHHTSLSFGEHHKDLFNILEDESEKRPIVVVLPRGHSKSTVANLIYVLHRICYNKERFIVIVSESYSQSVMFLEALKDELEYNAKLREMFGNLMRKEKWSEGEIETSNNIKVMAKGSGQRLRGLKYQNSRPTCIILDDFESEENTSTEVLREKLNRWIEGTIYPSLAKDGKIIFIGTIVHQASYLNKIRYMTDQFRVNDSKFWDIEGANGKPIWPARWSADEIKALRKRYDEMGYIDVFYREYKNIPISPENRLFKPDDIVYYDGGLKITDSGDPAIQLTNYDGVPTGEAIPVNLYAGLDPAMGKEKGDYTAIIVVGVGTDGNIYVIDRIRDKITPMDTIEKVFMLKKKYPKLRRIAIETVAYQEALAQFIRQESLSRGISIPIIQVRPRHSKVEKFADRITGLEPLFRQHRIRIHRQFQDLVSELVDFPKGSSDDLLDALWNALYNVLYKKPEKSLKYNVKKAWKRGKSLLNWRVT